MKKKNTFDIIVIGAGSGGLNIAGFMNKAGFNVLLIDKEDRHIGGDCLNTGCVPSKALIHVARQVRNGKDAERFGQTVNGTIDLKSVMDYVRDKQSVIREHENADHFRRKGIQVELGAASFVGSDVVEVSGRRYRGKKIVIATGSRPRVLDIPGIDSIPVQTNETIFNLESLPQRLLIVGAGPIGIELGQAFRALGSQVVVVGSKLLEKEDPDIVLPLKDQLEKDGIELLIGYRPKEVLSGDRMLVATDKGETKEVSFDIVLSSIGRDISVDPLHVSIAGIQTDARGQIIVDKYLRTTNKKVFVCGDVAGGHQFTHAAEVHAALLIRNFFFPFRKKLNIDAMSWVTYTTPEIATFGLQEAELRRRKMKYGILMQDFTDSDRAIVEEHTAGKTKIFVSPTGRILGGTMVAENAGEIAQELMLAQVTEIPLSSFMKKVYPYPTASRVNRTMAMSFMSRKLTKKTIRMLHFLFH